MIALRLVFFINLIFLLSVFTKAQDLDSLDSERMPLFYLGVYGDYNYNQHIADFDTLKDIQSCCPHYSNGSGSGLSLGGMFEIPIVKNVDLNFRFGFSTLNGRLSENETIGQQAVRVGNKDTTLDVQVDHSIYAKLYTAGFEPSINFSFFDHLNSQVGLRAAYLFTARLDISEKLIKPENTTFIDGSTLRNTRNDIELPDKQSWQFYGILGVGYELPLGKEMYIVPEIRFDIPFTNLSTVTWKPASFLFGAYLKIPVYPAKEIPIVNEKVYQRDTTVVAVMGLKDENVRLAVSKSEEFLVTRKDIKIMREVVTEHYIRQIPKDALLTAGIKATGIDKDGNHQDSPTIVIEETEWNEGFPLLPQVFFKEGSSDLSEAGLKLINRNEAESFNVDSLPWNTLDVYSNLLNIIAYRMQQFPKSNLTITGCNNDIGYEKGNLKLSEDRAIAVKDYMVSVWNIKSNRIIIKKQNLPSNPSNITIPDGQAENQRAELAATDPEILKPVNLKEVIKTSNPPVVEVIPSVNSEGGLKSWNISVEQEGKQLRSYGGEDAPKSVKWSVIDKPVPQFETPVDINLTAIDKYDQKITANMSLQIQQLTLKKKREIIKGDKKIERYSLIVFNYDKADITPQQETILEEIRSRIQPDSKVTISGYTDRTGSPDYNKDLARRRTLEVEKILQVPEKNLEISPVGSDVLLYNNDTPQGRSYSRTVQVVIETPIR